VALVVIGGVAVASSVGMIAMGAAERSKCPPPSYSDGCGEGLPLLVGGSILAVPGIGILIPGGFGLARNLRARLPSEVPSRSGSVPVAKLSVAPGGLRLRF